jgi:metallo-beta-lactamase family protein
MTKIAPTPTSSSSKQAVVTFWGAAQMVTGSMHLLEYDHQLVLLDCGLHQGKREDARRKNIEFPFHPKNITSVLVSHAHIDHCGNLPTLIRRGFEGHIFATPATRDLLAVMLIDSAKIQEEDATSANSSRRPGEPYIEPLYTRDDVDQVLNQVVPVPYNKTKELCRGIRFQFLEAGHVLGSAMVFLGIQGKTREHTLTFTGDLGRRGLPLLKPTAPIPACDVLVSESTYGNRVHEPIDQTIQKLYAAINRTVDRGGKVLIPAFSLGRSQLIIHYLQEGVRAGLIPKVPIFVDSPLAADVAEVYRDHPNCLGEDVAKHLEDGTGILGGKQVTYIRDYEDSIRLGHVPGPMIIVASSGMCDAGRIVHHLRQYIDDPRCSILLVSFQAPGTVGRKLLDKSPTIRFFGKEWNKWIEVVHLDGFSGHADKADFEEYLAPLVGKVGQIRLIHGEREQALALSETLRGMGFTDVGVPEPGDAVTMGS